MELSKGAGLSGENVEMLFDNAEKDLNFLVEAQARSTKAKPAKGR
jgi:hypothetical protein